MRRRHHPAAPVDAGWIVDHLSWHRSPVDDLVVCRTPRHLQILVSLTISGTLVAEPPISEEVPRRIGSLSETTARPAKAEAPTEDIRRIDLRAVEARTADRGPLDASLRRVEPGLQLPTAYEQVYQLDRGGFMRANGGLAATFDQSVYQPTARGEMPLIPASTVFVIGGVPLGNERGHGWLLGVDPLDPAAVPRPFAPTATPDDAYTPSATPGDRWRRFGFGAGYRMTDRVDPEGHEGGVDTSGSRFLRDDDYRALRLADRLTAWRSARSAATNVTTNRGEDSTTDAARSSEAAVTPADRAP
jgi:hypothetical protein